MKPESPITAKALLLLELRIEPGHGSRLIERIKSRTVGAITLGDGSVYPALRQLEMSGLVRAKVASPGARGGRSRVVYELTARGRKSAVLVAETIASLFC